MVIHRFGEGVDSSLAGRQHAHVQDERATADQKLRDLAQDQAGVVSRRQALDCGLSSTRIHRHLVTGRWQRIHRGVYAVFSGPVPRPALLWAAVLAAGPGAMLSHETAAELWTLAQQPSLSIHVTVPHQRTPPPLSGVVIHRSTHVAGRRHPTRMPPLTRIEHTVIDLTQAAGHFEDAVSWLARAIAGRFTKAERLRACLRDRRMVRWRSLLMEALGDVEQGCQSLLELAYLREVERAHRLPSSQRQVRRNSGQYDDVRYPDHGTRVELDGRAAHPEHTRWRDMRRDNAAVVEGDHVLRYGMGDVRESPCDVAMQVAAVLRAGGWIGSPRRCGRAACPFPA